MGLTNYNITAEQINEVCANVSNSIKGLTEVQNTTFPVAVIRAGIANHESVEEIAAKARDSIYKLPAHNNAYFNPAMEFGPNMGTLSGFVAQAIRDNLSKYVAE